MANLISLFLHYFRVFSHLTDTEHIEGGGVERFDVELLRSQRLYDHCLSGSGQVGHREVSRNRKS